MDDQLKFIRRSGFEAFLDNMISILVQNTSFDLNVEFRDNLVLNIRKIFKFFQSLLDNSTPIGM